MAWQCLAKPVVSHALTAPLVGRLRPVERTSDHRPAQQGPRCVVFRLGCVELLYLVEQVTDLRPFAEPRLVRVGRFDKLRLAVRTEGDARRWFLFASVVQIARFLVVCLVDGLRVFFRFEAAVPPPAAPAISSVAMGVTLGQRCDQIKVDANPFRLDQRPLLRRLRRIRLADRLGQSDEQFTCPLVMANGLAPVLAP